MTSTAPVIPSPSCVRSLRRCTTWFGTLRCTLPRCPSKGRSSTSPPRSRRRPTSIAPKTLSSLAPITGVSGRPLRKSARTSSAALPERSCERSASFNPFILSSLLLEPLAEDEGASLARSRWRQHSLRARTAHPPNEPALETFLTNRREHGCAPVQICCRLVQDHAEASILSGVLSDGKAEHAWANPTVADRGRANSREPPRGELRGTPLPRSRVHKGETEGRGGCGAAG